MMSKNGYWFLFFFSSRRRHTRWTGDWSSDVCSSDLPALAKAKQRARNVTCLNSLKQWSLSFQMYAEDNEDQVPEEGNTVIPINNNQNTDAWYNRIAPLIDQPSLVSLYTATPPSPPLPGDKTIFSCPSAPKPNFAPCVGRAYSYEDVPPPTPRRLGGRP